MKKMKKAAAMILSAAMALSAVSATSVGASAEWVKSKSGYSYKDDATGKKLTGWQTVGGSKYYFDKNGIALTGWKIINGETYYFNGAKKGKMLTGWAKISGKQYYFGSDGIMRTGWVKIKGSTYYFGSDGVMLTGTYKISGKVYTFGEDGKLNYTSAALGCNAAMVTNGITFYVTDINEVYETIPFGGKYIPEDERIIIFNTTDEDVGVYTFNQKNKVTTVFAVYSGFSKLEEVAPFFTEAGWKLKERPKLSGGVLTEVYLSPDESCFGCTIIEDGVTMVFIGSYDDIDKLYYDIIEEYK